jgi:hypothetical protein
MNERCPICGAKLKHGRKREASGYILRRRDCTDTSCDYADTAKYSPEVLLRTFEVRRWKSKSAGGNYIEQSEQDVEGQSLDVA